MTTTKDAKETKVRIYQLAKDLDVETSVLVDICRDAGFDKVRSQLSSVDIDQIDTIKKVLKARSAPPPSTPTPQPPPVLKQPMTARPPVLGGTKVPTISSAKPAIPTTEVVPVAEVASSQGKEPTEVLGETPAVVAKTPTSGLAASPAPTTPGKTLLSPDIQSQLRHLNKVRTLAPKTPPTQVQAVPSSSVPSKPSTGATTPSSARPTDRRSAVDRARPSTPYSVPPQQGRKKIVMPGSAPTTAPSSKPGVMKPLVKFTPDMMTGTKGAVSAKDLLRKIEEKQQADRTKARKDDGVADVDEEDEDGKIRPGLVKGREERHKRRSARAKAREDDVRKLTALLDEDEDRPTPQRLHRLHRQQRPATLPRKGTVIPVIPPITIRTLSEVLGIKAADILKKLIAKGETATINSTLGDLAAEEIAIELGFEIKIQKGQNVEEEVLAQFQKPMDQERLVHRPPVVTVMGHVDHGKTSLLDRIRESNVVATEAGGITQHIRAWKVMHGEKAITFLDTPGHAAFTQMRARGANVTDIVILVVAADDGIMPQTDEAISHAKAAGVPIIVAINKVDLPNANLNRTRQQLYAKELIPDDMGGDTPFIETVATKDRAKGIQELLDMVLLVAELKDLKADPSRAANGTCLEARVNGDEGVVANLLVQDGTLRRGDVILCGTTYGRARQMFDDHNQPLEEAGPSTPVRVIGLEAAPEASDKFYVVDDIAKAREIADDRVAKARDALTKRATFRLEDLGKAKAIEVKIIVKADVKGSIEAIKKELEKLHHEEVKIKLLHTAVGGITESDVQLALASPEDTLIVGFNVVPDDEARKLADEKGIQIQLYDIIYKLSDDLRSALEGKLKPREEVVHLGRAVVRDIFKISRVGTVAGCHVTSGTIERSARIRLIRDGVVIYPQADKTATLDSLKRHKDDVREVREGYECGMKITGYDDVKVGDVIEAFRVEQVQRTLN